MRKADYFEPAVKPQVSGCVFFRGEANHMDLGGATLKNTVDTDKSVSVDGISGYGARISVGKSF